MYHYTKEGQEVKEMSVMKGIDKYTMDTMTSGGDHDVHNGQGNLASSSSQWGGRGEGGGVDIWEKPKARGSALIGILPSWAEGEVCRHDVNWYGSWKMFHLTEQQLL